jgi:hypothetical protein
LGIGRWELFAAVALCAAVAGCGKKGPPLAPIVRVPAAVDKVAAQRIGNEIYLTLTIPTQNIDMSTPADVSRVEIFGVTSSTPPPRARIFEIASRVATVTVQPVVRPGQDAEAKTVAPAPAAQLPAQGTTVTVRDALTPADLLPKELPPSPAPARGVTPVSTPAATLPFPHRYYIAVAISDRGRTGPPGTLVDVPLPALPEPPGALTSSVSEDAVTLAWQPSGGIVGFLLEKTIPIEPAPVDEAAGVAGRATPSAAGPVTYNVYRETATEPDGSASAPASTGTPAAPINPAPIAGLTFADSTPFEFGRQRCYTVRALRGSPPNAVLSEPSERHCLTPVDEFPPAAPTALNSIAAEGVISLLWEPNGEADLGGYLVLRGQVGDATLQPLTESPVMGVRYEDRDVMAGVRYVYAVKAVDTQKPVPNVSAESNRVEETAR